MRPVSLDLLNEPYGQRLFDLYEIVTTQLIYNPLLCEADIEKDLAYSNNTEVFLKEFSVVNIAG